MTTKTQTIVAILAIATFAIAVPGLGDAFAVKTYATYWYDAPPSNWYGVSSFYTADDRVRTGALNDATWLRMTSMGDLLEIGWIDLGGTIATQYYCGIGGNVNRYWGSPSDGSTTTYYIYDVGNDGTFDLIGGADYCQFNVGSYSVVKAEVGYEDHQNSNVLENNLHKNLKYYDGTWHNWSWASGSSHGKVESAATVAYCTANYEAKIGDTATC
jgi:hypothetical protein